MLKNRLIYAAFLIAALLLYVFWGEYTSLFITLLLIFLPILLYFTSFIAGFCLGVRVKIKETQVFKTEPAEIAVEIVNRSFIYVPYCVAKFEIRNEFSDAAQTREIGIRLCASDKKPTRVETEIASEYCGETTIKLISVRLYDALGLTRRKRRLIQNASVTFLPEMFERDLPVIGAAPTEEESDCYSEHKKGQDKSQVFDYHEYRSGDKMSAINWKLSAKMSELMVREFSLPLDNRVLIIQEGFNKADGIEIKDGVISVTSSLLLMLNHAGIGNKIAFFSREEGFALLPPEETGNVIFSVNRLLKAGNSDTENEVLRNAADKRMIYRYAKIYYVCTSVDEELLTRLERENIAASVLWVRASDEKFGDALNSQKISRRYLGSCTVSVITAGNVEKSLLNAAL